jgi:hypothetical protein
MNSRPTPDALPEPASRDRALHWELADDWVPPGFSGAAGSGLPTQPLARRTLRRGLQPLSPGQDSNAMFKNSAMPLFVSVSCFRDAL